MSDQQPFQQKSGRTFCILGASFGTPNMGVSALAASTVASIFHSFPDARVFLLDYGKLPAAYQVRHAGGVGTVELVNIRFSWRIHLPNNIARLIAVALVLKLLPSRRLRERMVSRNPYLRAIAEADVVGSLAGGDSFSDIYGLRRLFYMTLPQLLVLLLGKPLTLLPQTLGPFKGRVAKSVGGYIMRNAERVYARDRESLDEVRPLMGSRESKLGISYDMAFLLEPIAPSSVNYEWLRRNGQHKPLVGLNVSGLLYHGGYTKDNMFGLQSDYKELVRQIIAYFIEQQGARVVLVPHVFGPATDLESDPAAAMAIYREFESQYPGSLHLITGEYDQHEIKYLIGKCDFFLGSRMHACIAALSQCVPAVGLAYSKKFLGVLRTIGVEDWVVDLRHCDVAKALSLIDRAYLHRAAMREELGRRMPEVKQQVGNLFHQIVFKRDGQHPITRQALVPPNQSDPGQRRG